MRLAGDGDAVSNFKGGIFDAHDRFCAGTNISGSTNNRERGHISFNDHVCVRSQCYRSASWHRTELVFVHLCGRSLVWKKHVSSANDNGHFH
ncbi:hypothetical protein PoB_000451300 [Plakobranchus ocellatus]|uniref:Uncharacterized protein n=1 Tax=Plakobranchus ocellatus TaxID=259542 RepID=A0AAV3Y737_9GAST|nr:hypothetical protein PoB_000451300 [Plakobranchus ocellatus]